MEDSWPSAWPNIEQLRTEVEVGSADPGQGCLGQPEGE
jgi:hypothetical protein